MVEKTSYLELWNVHVYSFTQLNGLQEQEFRRRLCRATQIYKVGEPTRSRSNMDNAARGVIAKCKLIPCIITVAVIVLGI